MILFIILFWIQITLILVSIQSNLLNWQVEGTVTLTFIYKLIIILIFILIYIFFIFNSLLIFLFLSLFIIFVYLICLIFVGYFIIFNIIADQLFFIFFRKCCPINWIVRLIYILIFPISVLISSGFILWT